ncbi:MAG: hypothetical protein ACK5EK_04110 [Flavobacteriia bacterium]|jgi:hypothetical protein
MISRKLLSFLLFTLFTGTSLTSQAQIELPEDKVNWSFTLEQNGCEATVIAKIKVIEHWHINATKLPKGSFGFPTGFELKTSPNFKTVGGVIEPKPIEKYDELADESLAYHEGSFLLKRKIKITSEKDFELTGTFSFQTCNDVKCLPDHAVTFKLRVKGCKVEGIEVDQTKLKSEFKKIENDVAIHSDGSTYVFVHGKWQQVPEGNSVEFYKKYLSITQKDEE